MTNLIKRANEIALKVHKNQKDKLGYPYEDHIKHVALEVQHLGINYEITGLLHDAIEDAEPNEFKKEIVLEIKKEFSKEVQDAIKSMSKKKNEDYFQDYLPRLKQNIIAIEVKKADASHNLGKAHLIEDSALQNKLRKKYKRVLKELGAAKLYEERIYYSNNEWRSIEIKE